MGKKQSSEYSTIHINRKLHEEFMRMVVNKHGFSYRHFRLEVEAALRAHLKTQPSGAEPTAGGD
jgi:hypothetical protein